MLKDLEQGEKNRASGGLDDELNEYLSSQFGDGWKNEEDSSVADDPHTEY